MARLVPNDNSWIGFSTTAPASMTAPTTANMASATDLTPWCISLNASAQGNTVPTPTIDTLFETSIPGTNAATFTADFYRDSNPDTAWITLPRNTAGWFYVSRWNTSSANNQRPIAGTKIEIWPVIVTSRAAAALASNTAQTFTVTCAVTAVPSEDVAVV